MRKMRRTKIKIKETNNNAFFLIFLTIYIKIKIKETYLFEL
jgi:hypothetical protein